MAKGAEIGGEITTLSGAQRSWLLSSGICLDSSAFLSPRLYIVPFSFPLLLTGNATPLRSHSGLSWEMPVCSSSLASSALLSAWCFALTRVLTARLAWVLPPRIAYLPFWRRALFPLCCWELVTSIRLRNNSLKALRIILAFQIFFSFVQLFSKALCSMLSIVNSILLKQEKQLTSYYSCQDIMVFMVYFSNS